MVFPAEILTCYSFIWMKSLIAIVYPAISTNDAIVMTTCLSGGVFVGTLWMYGRRFGNHAGGANHFYVQQNCDRLHGNVFRLYRNDADGIDVVHDAVDVCSFCIYFRRTFGETVGDFCILVHVAYFCFMPPELLLIPACVVLFDGFF